MNPPRSGVVIRGAGRATLGWGSVQPLVKEQNRVNDKIKSKVVKDDIFTVLKRTCGQLPTWLTTNQRVHVDYPPKALYWSPNWALI